MYQKEALILINDTYITTLAMDDTIQGNVNSYLFRIQNKTSIQLLLTLREEFLIVA